MDCEKFDRIVLDLLYDELDELTSAAAKRHVEHCSRCRNIMVGLRATREVGVLPLEEAPPGLETRILEAERQANAVLPLRKRVGRAISLAASYAMRPQLAMAALLLLMIGSSLLLLRARPGARESVQVTERGIPESEGDPVAIVPAPAGAEAPAAAPAHGVLREEKSAHHEKAKATRDRDEPADDLVAQSAPAASAAAADAAVLADKDATDGGADDYGRAMAAYRAGRYAEAGRRFDAIAAAGGEKAASAALYAARATRNSSGCGAAAARFDEVGARYRGSSIGNDATWQAADCYRSMGQTERARRNYQLLLAAASYADRAQRALADLDGRSAGAVAARAAEARPKAAAPAAKAVAKPAPPPPNATDVPQADEPAK